MILNKQQDIIRDIVEKQNTARERKLNVDGLFTDADGVEYLAISTEGDSWLYGAIKLMCEASGLRFYGVEWNQKDNRLCLMLF